MVYAVVTSFSIHRILMHFLIYKSKMMTNFVDFIALQSILRYYVGIQHQEVHIMNMLARKAKKQGRRALIRLALQEHKSLSDIMVEIQEVIDATWEAPTPELLELFPEGKPGPALFVGILAAEVKGT